MITFTHPSRSVVLRQRIRTLACSPVLVVLCFCLAATTPLHLRAQTSKGILAGVIRDSSGALLPNATILITNEDTHENARRHLFLHGRLPNRSDQSRQLSHSRHQ